LNTLQVDGTHSPDSTLQGASENGATSMCRRSRALDDDANGVPAPTMMRQMTIRRSMQKPHGGCDIVEMMRVGEGIKGGEDEIGVRYWAHGESISHALFSAAAGA
jgi:hypothetical protein